MSDTETPVSTLPTGWKLSGTTPINCTAEKQAERLQAMEDLKATMRGPLSVGDRGRSVTYRSPADMQRALVALNNEWVFCETGAWPVRGARIFYIPQGKNL